MEQPGWQLTVYEEKSLIATQKSNFHLNAAADKVIYGSSNLFCFSEHTAILYLSIWSSFPF